MTASTAHFTNTARDLMARENLSVQEKAFAEAVMDFGSCLSDEEVARARTLPLSTVQRWRKIAAEHGSESLSHLGAGSRFLVLSAEHYAELSPHLTYPLRTEFDRAVGALAALARGSLLAELAKSWNLGAGSVLSWKPAFEVGGLSGLARATGRDLSSLGARPQPEQAPPALRLQEAQPELPLVLVVASDGRAEQITAPPATPPHTPLTLRRAEDGRRALENLVRPPFAPERRLAEKQSTLMFPEPQRKNGQTIKRGPVTVMKKSRIHATRKAEREAEPVRIIEPIPVAVQVQEQEQTRVMNILEPVIRLPEPQCAQDEEADLFEAVSLEPHPPEVVSPAPLPEATSAAVREPAEAPSQEPEVRTVAPPRRPTPRRAAAKAAPQLSAPPPARQPRERKASASLAKPQAPQKSGPPQPSPAPAGAPPAAAGAFFSGKNEHRWHAVMEFRASHNMMAVSTKYGVSKTTLEKWLVALAMSGAARP